MNPSWLQIAHAEVGQQEIAGAQHNSRILAYHGTTSLNARTDEVPWCASFVGWCLEQAGLQHPRSARARDYAEWGVPLERPVLGAVVVLTRPGGGHVGFYVGQRDGQWLILGGNQSNRVNVAPYAPSRMVAVRWPSGVALPNAAAPLSKSGVVQGSVVAGLATMAQIGHGLLEQPGAVATARGWMQDGTIVGLVLGVVALAGVVWAILARRAGKRKAEAEK